MAEETALQRAARYFRATVAFYKRECHPRLIRFYKFVKQKNQQYKQFRDTQKQIAKDRAAQEAEATRKRQAEIEEEQAAERRAAYDPEAAVEDMRLARSYLDDWGTNKGEHVLGLAAKYTESARYKDPNAKLVVEIENGKTLTLTLDDLAGDTLYYEAFSLAHTDAPPEKLIRARDLLQRSIAYCPDMTRFRQKLAEVHLNLHDKQSALAVAEEAVRRQPKNLDARKLLDFVQAAPETQAPTVMDTNPSLPFLLAAFALGILAIIAAFRGYFTSGFELFVVALIVGWIGNYLEKDRLLAKAIEKQAKERANNQ
jgi:hypothetical protein